MNTDLAISLRHETADDADFVFNLFAHVHSKQLGLGCFSMVESLLKERFSEQCATFSQCYPGAFYHIVESRNQPVGRMIVHSNTRTVHVVDMMVLPDKQGQGIGRHALSHILKEVDRIGAVTRLCVAQNNVRAKALYTRLGFRTELLQGFNEQWVRGRADTLAGMKHHH